MTTLPPKLEEEGPTPSKSPVEKCTPKDRGFLCWLQVIGCFASWANSFGLVNAYGEFQTYYESTLSQSPGSIAWIGSIQSFILLSCGFFTGPLFDIGYFRPILISGHCMILIGLFLTSICKEYWQIIVTQGIVIGIGMGCIFIPSLAILPQYFSNRLQFANGIAAVGSGFGGVIYPIVLRRLTPQIGFPWTVRVLGFMTLFFAVVSVIALRNKSEPKKMRRLIPPGLRQDSPFLIYTAGLFVILVALYIPAVYVTSYSIETHTAGPKIAFYLVPVLQAANIFGRLLAFFADHTGPINLTIPALLIAGILAFSWIAIRSLAGILFFAILYGVCFGIIQGLGPGCIVSLTSGGDNLGSRMGLSFSIASVGLLIGTPTAGSLLGNGNNFLGVQLFTGGLLSVSTLLYIACRVGAVGFGATKL